MSLNIVISPSASAGMMLMQTPQLTPLQQFLLFTPTALSQSLPQIALPSFSPGPTQTFSQTQPPIQSPTSGSLPLKSPAPLKLPVQNSQGASRSAGPPLAGSTTPEQPTPAQVQELAALSTQLMGLLDVLQQALEQEKSFLSRDVSTMAAQQPPLIQPPFQFGEQRPGGIILDGPMP